MISRWTSHLKDAEDKQKFVNEILSARHVFEHLFNLIEEDERGLSASEINMKSYSDPSWAYLQAHKNGMRQYMKQMKALLTLDQQKGTTE